MKTICKVNLKSQVIENINRSVIEKPYETDALLKHFDKILEGHGNVCFVVGEAGIGKTTFVNQVVKSLVRSDIHCIYGKFRKHESKPFSAFSEIVENAVKQLLTLPFDQLDSVKKNLMSAVGR